MVPIVRHLRARQGKAPGDRTGVVMTGGEPSLEAAKAALKVEYEKWSRGNLG